MSLESEVRNELTALDGDKAKLMQKYADEQKKIVDFIGGSISDIPVGPDFVEHPYYKLQRKIQALNYLGK